MEFSNTSIDSLKLTDEPVGINYDVTIKNDPADEIIAATSVVHRVPLVTRDRRIRRSKLVPLAK